MKFQRISILVLVYNEVQAIRDILQQVDAADAAGLEKGLIIVGDGSTDGTRELLETLDGLKTPFQVLFHAQNMGKGAAVQRALAYASGEFTLIQNADLGYDPREYPELLAPILAGRAPLLLMAGAGHRAHWPREADRLGLRDRVRLLGRREDMVDLYQTADPLVFPSRGEGKKLTWRDGSSTLWTQPKYRVVN